MNHKVKTFFFPLKFIVVPRYGMGVNRGYGRAMGGRG